ncbi:unnamed protein product [Mesocestoides corti]|uniref:Charged multivesicular body protein 7 n=1 Tax=Mesocestoides corti TaxID=53468 RepID=A0A158QVK9_MESCO|nr:unnamed protein product [Mesocestoides corti]
MGADFQLPDEWADDDEIYRLFQRIKRPRSLDTVSYDRKVLFWRNLILEYTKCHRILVVTESALKTVFKRQFISDGTTLYPQCLHQVLSNMFEDGLVKVSRLDGTVSGILNLSVEWLIKKPVSWAWSYFTGADSQSSDLDARLYGSPETPLLVAGLLSTFCEQFVGYLKETQSSLAPDAHVYTEEDFETALHEFFTHESTLDFIRKHLYQQEIVRIDSSAPIRLIFLVSDKNPTNLDPTVLSSIAHLRKTMRQITNDEARLSKDLMDRRSKVKSLMRQNRKSEALAQLRRCKHLEAELERKSKHMAHLEALELKIGAAKDNRSVLKAMSEATSALKRTTGGLEGVADAEDTIDEMAELIDESNAISSAIGEPLNGLFSNTVDSDQLEAELKEILGDSDKVPPTKPAVLESVTEEELMRQLDALDVSDLPPLNQPKVAGAQARAQ